MWTRVGGGQAWNDEIRHRVNTGDPPAINNKELEQDKACSRGNRDNKEIVSNM